MVSAAVRSRVVSRMTFPGAPVVSETYEKLWDAIPVYQIGVNKTRDYVLLLQLANHFCINLGIVYDVIDKFPEHFRSPSASLVRLARVGDRTDYAWIFKIARNMGSSRSVPTFIDVRSAIFLKDIALPRYFVDIGYKERDVEKGAQKTKVSPSSPSSPSLSTSSSSPRSAAVVVLGQVDVEDDILDGPPTEDDEEKKETKDHEKKQKRKKRKKRKGNPCGSEASRSAPKASRAAPFLPSAPSPPSMPLSGVPSPFVHAGTPYYVQLNHTPLRRDPTKLQFTKMGHFFKMRYEDLMRKVKDIWPSFYNEHMDCTNRIMVLLAPTVFPGPKGPTIELVYNKDSKGLMMTRMGHFMCARYRDALRGLRRRYKASSPAVQKQYERLNDFAIKHNDHTRQLYQLVIGEHVQLVNIAAQIQTLEAKNQHKST